MSHKRQRIMRVSYLKSMYNYYVLTKVKYEHVARSLICYERPQVIT